MRDRSVPEERWPNRHRLVVVDRLGVMRVQRPEWIRDDVVGVVEVDPLRRLPGGGTAGATGQFEWGIELGIPDHPQRERTTQGVKPGQGVATLERSGRLGLRRLLGSCLL